MTTLELDKVLKCLADANRMQIVRLLSQRKYCVRALSSELGISESAVSQHIKSLKDAGLLELGDKHGYHIHYAVKKDTLLQAAAEIQRLAEQVQTTRSCGGHCQQGGKEG